MKIKAGLVGLPNVGKSTIFNALTKSQIPAENYPFCTIDPHVAITEVPDNRTARLQKIYSSQKTIPATVTFVDIAGLVKGAASGEGLGNQFLANIRDTNLILHVLRCFEDPNIMHSGNTIDPIADYEIVLQELILKDLESITLRLEKIAATIKRSNDKEKKKLDQEAALLVQLREVLDQADNSTARDMVKSSTVSTIPLLSTKDFLVIANVAEDELEDDAYQNNPNYKRLIEAFGTDRVIPLSAKLEYELTQLSATEAAEIMGMLAVSRRGIDDIITKTFTALGLITFFTCGPKEIHAWPIQKGTTVREAAGEIHSDLERGFICADLFNCDDLFQYESISQLKSEGKFRTEGHDYIVQDGDIINIKFNI